MSALPRPDAEAAWINWFKQAGYPTATHVPVAHVDGMTRVSRVGGTRLNLVQDKAQMLIETWHSDPYQASQTAHKLAEVMESAVDGTHLDTKTRVSDVTTTGPIEFPDSNSALFRYQFTAESLLRRVAS